MPDRFIPSGFASSTLDLLTPKRNVIIDMIMVQVISAIVVLMMILLFKGNDLPANIASYYLIGLFGSVIMLTGIYARITRIH
tara:strand:- start:2450 stop:2695 length:246 start_codon:yes stop_codon:yes gene_type:complete